VSVKILSQSGISLADAYDVQGSIAGVERLDSEEVKTVHEMGGTMFSERFQGALRRRETGDIAQNTNWAQLITDLPAGPSRVFAVAVFAESDDVSHAVVSIRDPVSEREVPIWQWNTGVDTANLSLWQDSGAAVAAIFYLRPLVLMGIPSFIIGGDQRVPVPDIAFRGRTTAFGAGTVNVILTLYIGHTHVGGLSSFGLPIPSW